MPERCGCPGIWSGLLDADRPYSAFRQRHDGRTLITMMEPEWRHLSMASVLERVLELSSMDGLMLKRSYPSWRSSAVWSGTIRIQELVHGNLPYTIGGGIGQCASVCFSCSGRTSARSKLRCGQRAWRKSAVGTTSSFCKQKVTPSESLLLRLAELLQVFGAHAHFLEGSVQLLG